MRALIEARDDTPGRVTVLGESGEGDFRLALTALKRAELFGLANELRARGVQVELRAADVEAAVPAHGAEAALRELGFAPPYKAYRATLARARPSTP